MKFYPDDLFVDKFDSHFSENEFYLKYLKNTSLRGFYYDNHERSFGLILQFLNTNHTRLSMQVLESDGLLPVMEYSIHSHSFIIDSVAYDKILISTSRYNLEKITPSATEIRLPNKIEFTLQLLTRNTFFIRFLDSEQFASPIRLIKGGLVLAKETVQLKEELSRSIVSTGIAFDKYDIAT
jgi:hypothetical protein